MDYKMDYELLVLIILLLRCHALEKFIKDDKFILKRYEFEILRK